jgi:hypothetical protein
MWTIAEDACNQTDIINSSREKKRRNYEERNTLNRLQSVCKEIMVLWRFKYA